MIKPRTIKRRRETEKIRNLAVKHIKEAIITV
jgi:hypothetical protein